MKKLPLWSALPDAREFWFMYYNLNCSKKGILSTVLQNQSVIFYHGYIKYIPIIGDFSNMAMANFPKLIRFPGVIWFLRWNWSFFQSENYFLIHDIWKIRIILYKTVNATYCWGREVTNTRTCNLADLPETLEPEYFGPCDTIGVEPMTLTPASFTRSVFCLDIFVLGIVKGIRHERWVNEWERTKEN